MVVGKHWTGEVPGDFDYTEPELLLTYDGDEIDIALATPDGHQQAMLASVKVVDVLRVVVAPQ